MSHLGELRRLGLKGTTQRAIILDVLESSGRHLSAEEVAAAVTEKGLHLNRSTIYRTLDVLADIGMLRASRIGRSTYYEVAGADDDHHHAVCSSCHRTVHLAGNRVDQVLGREAARIGFEVVEIQVLVSGLCPGCRDAPAAGSAESPAP